MKTFKQIDVWIQMLMILVFTILSLIRQDATFIIGYFTVGGWQVISMVAHEVGGSFTNAGSRRYYYHRLTLFTVLFMLLSMWLTPLLLIFGILLFAAPVLALYYLYICYKEWQVLAAQELIHLK